MFNKRRNYKKREESKKYKGRFYIYCTKELILLYKRKKSLVQKITFFCTRDF